MEGKPYGAAANRVYEDIEPSAEWVREEGFDTLIVNLQGYRKENLRIQVTSTRNIRVLGERSLSHENNKWQRFRKEFPIPSNCDVNETTARFDNGMLYVKIPKTIAPAVDTAAKEQKLPKSTTEIPKPPPPPPQKPTTTAHAAQKTNALSQEQEPFSKAVREKQTIGDPKANDGPQSNASNSKTPEKEKVNKIISETITDDNSKKASTGEEQSDPMGANAKITQEKSQTEEVSRSGEKGTVMEDLKGTVASEYCRRRTQLQGRNYYRQVVDGMVMELKEPRRLLNLVLALVFLLVLGLYVKHAVNSIQEFKREEL